MAGDRLRPFERDAPGVRESEPAGRALEQSDADLALQLRDLARHGGLGEEERLRRLRERAVADDLPEQRETAWVEHYRSV